MNKAIFLDRDGTINIEKHYLYKIDDFEFLPGVIQALKRLQDAGYLLIIVTNQSGIARGYYTEREYEALSNWMIGELRKHDVIISAVYYCPHLPDATVIKYRKDCNCRKPKLGMYRQAIVEHDIMLPQSYAIGDKIRDCAICEQTDCRGFLIGLNEDPTIIERVRAGEYTRVKYASSLAEAASMILNASK